MALVMTLMPRCFERPLQQVAGGRVELALHQRRHQVEDGHVHAARAEPGRGLEAEQAAADDDGPGARLGRRPAWR